MSDSNVIVLPVARAHAGADAGPRENAPDEVGVSRFGYRVGPMNFLVPAGMVSEVFVAPTVTPLPRGVGWLAGLTNIRGNIVPVFNLHPWVDAPRAGAERRTVLLLDRGSRMLGLLVDGLPQALLQPTTTAETPPLRDPLPDFSGTAFAVNGNTWIEFDAHGFFTRLAANSTSMRSAALR
jgi:chemotaxis signal transduction protein